MGLEKGWQRRNIAAKSILLLAILRLWTCHELRLRAGRKEKPELQLELSCQRKRRAAERLSP